MQGYIEEEERRNKNAEVDERGKHEEEEEQERHDWEAKKDDNAEKDAKKIGNWTDRVSETRMRKTRGKIRLERSDIYSKELEICMEEKEVLLHQQ
jgi:hypothetical protein